jgi:hypothetical protein
MTTRNCSLVLILLVPCSGWPLGPRPSQRTTIKNLLFEVVEAARDQDLKAPNFFDFFLAPNITKVQRKDWGRQLGAAFENFRVPAALVAGIALTAAFQLPPNAADNVVDAVAKRLYHLLSLCSFMSSMITVALATSALVQLNDRDAGQNSNAENLEDYIVRAGFELGRERWLAVNAHFIISVVTLCAAVGLRSIVAFPDRTFGVIGAMLVVSGLLTAVSLGLPNGVLSSIICRHVKVVLTKAFSWHFSSPALLAASLLMAAAASLSVRELAAIVRGSIVAQR